MDACYERSELARAWVLDTETKGTGAERVPLEKVQKQPPRRRRRPVRAPDPKPRPSAEPGPRGPRRFKVVDVMSGRVLAEGAGTQATLELLRGIRSVVDVRIYVWEREASDWRPLTLAEQKSLWRLRGSEDESARRAPARQPRVSRFVRSQS